MLLKEIRDISDYRRGDEDDPRSPYYEDPDNHEVPEEFYPDMPVLSVNTSVTKAPNGEECSFVLSSTFTEPKDDDYEIAEYAMDKLDGDPRFSDAEIVDDARGKTNGRTTWSFYYKVPASYPVKDVMPTLERHMKDKAEQIAKQNALKHRAERKYRYD